MLETTVTHEPVDDIPVVSAWLRNMRVDTLVDMILPRPHGNWQGLSYGQVTVMWLTYMLTQCDHRMCPVADWVAERLTVLGRCTGWPVSAQDLTDDRLEAVLDLLGDDGRRPWEALDRELGQHLVRAYRLPTDTARIDTSTFSLHHGEQAPDGQTYSLLRFGKSKDQRPDLRQFVQALGTLDPAGVPLVSVMLRGNQNDSPVYLPVWRHIVEIVGRPDFLLVGDCKLSSVDNRAQLQAAGGLYLSPLAQTGAWPNLLQTWVLDPPVAVEDIWRPEQAPAEAPAYRGFVLALGTLDPSHPQQGPVGWMEQVFVVCNTRTAAREVAALQRRLSQAEAALARLASRPGVDRAALQHRVTSLLAQKRVADYLQVYVEDQVQYEERLVGRGRTGPNRPKHVMETHRLVVTVTRRTTAIQQAEQLAGWRLYVSNAAPDQLSLAQSIDYYCDQWQPERGFHRWKRGELPALPLYLKYEARIRGLMVLLSIGLRVLTLVEFVVRRELGQRHEKLAGLYEGNRQRATDRPTTERLLRAFAGIVLYCCRTGEQVSYQLTPLTDLHQHILHLMSLPADLYARLMPGAELETTS